MECKVENIIKNLVRFYPEQRMLNTYGVEKVLKELKTECDKLKILEFYPGYKMEEWEVPYRWELVYGEMLDSNGNKVVSTDDNILFVNAYSDSVEGCFKRAEIEKHLSLHPQLDDVFLFEHRLAFDFKNPRWGISLPRVLWESLNDDEYYISIKTKRDNTQPMCVGELDIHGQKKETILICGHIDEQLCNDDLTGSLVGFEVFKDMLTRNVNTKYSYKLLLFPETIGSFAYAYKYFDKLKDIVGILNLEMLGAGDEWYLKSSLNEDSYFDKVLALSCKSILQDYKKVSFFAGPGNDERTFAWPSIDIPGVSLQKWPFKYYHSSKDNPDIVDPKNLELGLKVVENFISIIENDYIPSFTHRVPIKLSSYGLYYDDIYQPEKANIFNNHVLYSINEKNSLTDISYKYNLDFFELSKHIELFNHHGLLEKKDILIKPKEA